MALIVNGFKTKKELKEAVKAGIDFEIYDPSICNERCFYLRELKDNESIVVTNHPKRSWFTCIKKINGKLTVS